MDPLGQTQSSASHGESMVNTVWWSHGHPMISTEAGMDVSHGQMR